MNRVSKSQKHAVAPRRRVAATPRRAVTQQRRTVATRRVAPVAPIARRAVSSNTSLAKFSPVAFRHVPKMNFSAEAAAQETSSFEMILHEKRGKVGIITLNRPKALNALCDQLISEVNAQLTTYDNDPEVGAIVITGTGKAFAAGADIKEMANQTHITAYKKKMLAFWADMTKISKPTIAAVNGFALGGGCEFAMMCDILIASSNAKFGQPEILLGTIPGCGGTQRLTRAVGKSKAMEWILTGKQFTADEAERSGLASRVVAPEALLDDAVATAELISSFSKPIVGLAKDAVNAAYETTLTQGVHYERRLFHSTFGTHDQQEGMKAFIEKRKPLFKDE